MPPSETQALPDLHVFLKTAGPWTGESIDIAHYKHGGSHLITFGDAAALHHRARAALSAEMDAHDGTLPLVVVTHHAPHPDCITPAQRGT